MCMYMLLVICILSPSEVNPNDIALNVPCATCRHVYPLPFQAEEVLSLPVSVRPPVCPSLCELYLVRTVTRHNFELE